MFHRLRKLDTFIGKLEERISALFSEIRVSVIRRETQSPILSYLLPSSHTLSELRSRAESIPLDFGFYREAPLELRTLFCLKREDLRRRLTIISSMGTDAFRGSVSECFYDLYLQEEDLGAALTFLRDALPKHEQNPYELLSSPQDENIFHGNDVWCFRIGPLKKKLLSQESSRASQTLHAHASDAESQTLYRRCQGIQQRFPNLFAYGIDSTYRLVDFGLASLIESDDISGSWHGAARYVAAFRMAQGASYQKIFDELSQYLAVKDADQIALAVKIGVVDTRRSGGDVTGALAFYGARKLRAFYSSSEGRFLELDRARKLLYCGAVGFSHLPLLQELETKGLLRLPDLLARWDPLLLSQKKDLLRNTAG